MSDAAIAPSLPIVDYNRCGIASPIRARFDLDSKAELAHRADIRLGPCPEPKARLRVSGANFRLMSGEQSATQVTLQLHESARLAVPATDLLAAAAEGRNPIALSG